MTWAIALSIGIFVGWLAGFGVYQIQDWLDKRKSRKATAVWDKDPNGDTYGHPYHPAQELAKKLKPPPDGYAWEVLIEWDSDPYLKLRLLNIATEVVEDSIEQNLWMQYGSIRQTWKKTYADYRDDHKESAFDNLTYPFTQWANEKIIEYRPKKTGIEHYEVIV
ncbi:hypothetical protein [Nocardia jiangxiensis]|uniref:hypothetical protein n=1 Tax=Nocardia jiangxiensis TaxID=282685 RepID=UPI0002E9EB64|nr:hypothetical protein [Nocardia jiangxiensis]